MPIYRDPIKRKAWNDKYRKHMQTIGLCQCGNPRVTKWQCQRCISYPRDRVKCNANERNRIARNRAAGLCPCGKSQAENRKMCGRCLEYRRKYSRNLGATIKVEVLGHYSGGIATCIRCNLTDLRVLTLDHINGGGNESRRAKCWGMGGWQYYRALKKLGYPEGYQVLCLNCHLIVEAERDAERLSKLGI